MPTPISINNSSNIYNENEYLKQLAKQWASKAKRQYNSAIATNTTAQANINFDAYLRQAKQLLKAEAKISLSLISAISFYPISPQ